MGLTGAETGTVVDRGSIFRPVVFEIGIGVVAVVVAAE